MSKIEPVWKDDRFEIYELTDGTFGLYHDGGQYTGNYWTMEDAKAEIVRQPAPPDPPALVP